LVGFRPLRPPRALPLDPLLQTAHPLDPLLQTTHPLDPLLQTTHPLDPLLQTAHPLDPLLQTILLIQRYLLLAHPLNLLPLTARLSL